jgi:hypothetical protein
MKMNGMPIYNEYMHRWDRTIPANVANTQQKIRMHTRFGAFQDYCEFDVIDFDSWPMATDYIAITPKATKKKGKHDRYNPTAFDRLAQSKLAKFGKQ